MITIMNTTAETITPVRIHERGQDRKFASIDTPQKQTARGHAALCAMNYLPIKALPVAITETANLTTARGSAELSTPATEYLKAYRQTESAIITPERTSKKERRKSKLRRALGAVVTRANMLALGIYNTPARLSAAEEEWHSREEFQRQKGDGLVTRAQKAVGRNAIRGLVMGGGAAAYLGVAYLNTQGHEIPRVTDAKVKTLEVQELANITAYYGGRTDGNANMYMQYAKDTGTFDTLSDNRAMEYSAQMAPLDPQTMKESIKPAVNEGLQVYYEAKAQGRGVEYKGFSEGGLPAVDTVQELARRGEDLSNVKLTIDGSTVGKYGIYQNGAPQAVMPVLDMMGMKTDVAVPEGIGEVVIRTYSGDPIGNGGMQSSGSLLAKAVLSSSTHRAIEGGATLISSEKVGNVTYEEYMNPQGVISPLSVALVDAGAQVTPAGDRLLDSFLPTTHIGEETQYANAYEVKDATKEFITDTIRRNNGIEAGQIVDPVVNAVFNDERAGDAQAVLDVVNKTPDKFVEMVNNPATIPQNMESIGRDLDAGMQTVGKYLNPGTWMEMLNDGIRGAGVPIPEYVAPAQAPAPVYVPGPEQFAPVAPPPPPPIPDFAPQVQEFNQNLQNGINEFNKNLQNLFKPFGG